jgi:hypothetical protein
LRIGQYGRSTGQIDAIEAVLLKMGGGSLVAQGAGYRVAYAVAEDNLQVGGRFS